MQTGANLAQDEADPPVDAVCYLVGINKSYDGVRALRDVSVSFRRGEVHALLGENGAGKSTLMKILAGAERADSGSVNMAGRDVAFRNVRDANGAGISCVFQETSLFGDLDVLTNLFINGLPTRCGVVSRAQMLTQSKSVLARVGLHIDLDTKVKNLTLAERQLVEIAKGLLVDASLLILDEPNSALTTQESQRLFALVRQLCADGVAVVYVSHRLEEVFGIADRVTVLRDGRLLATRPRDATSIPQVVAMMIGPKQDRNSPALERTASAEEVIALRGVSSAAMSSVSLTLTRGEILGVVGLDGAGQVELMRTLFGLSSVVEGEADVLGVRGVPRSPVEAVRRGIAYVPSDRAAEGIFAAQQIHDNVAHVFCGVLGLAGRFPRRQNVSNVVATATSGLHVKMRSTAQLAGNLSGGNQQKVFFAKWAAASAGLMLLNDPTRGVDVGAKSDIYEAMRDLAASGAGIVFTTTDFEEVPIVCDRVLIFYRGGIVGERRAVDTDAHQLLEAVNSGRLP